MASNGRDTGSPSSMPWFHGKISREVSERRLKPFEDGLFLVRDSEHYQGDYTLSVCYAGKVEHYHIYKKGSKLTIDEDVSFHNLSELVEHYQKGADGLCTNLGKLSPDPLHLVPAELRIPFSEIKLGDLIGKGEFSEVHKANFHNQDVAAKKLNYSSDEDGIMQEVKLMGSLNHKNLVRMLGVAVKDATLYIITEFMPRGSLVDYLRTRGRAAISLKDQLKFAKDSCAGMVYLESKNIVHRDLAARNVLIDEKLNAKVSDLGLARNVNAKHAISKIPIKWTAPEALKNSSDFTSKSDVWSFGILLWEIYSFGRVPYPKTLLSDVQQYLEEGGRMDPPEACPPEIYEIMKKSWSLKPADRPTFEQIFDDIKVLSSTPV